MKKYLLLVVFLCFASQATYAQPTLAKGVVLDQHNKPLSNVKVTSGINSTLTSKTGFYTLAISYTNDKTTIAFTKEMYEPASVQLVSDAEKVKEINILLLEKSGNLQEIFIQKGYQNTDSAIVIPAEVIRTIPGANAGVENILATLPGVNSNNELSTQYAVRGGNYDENLVYVNGIELYRPYLIRSGKQEGLSAINPTMIENIRFYAGGFDASFGDKLSSVLDLTYRTPIRNRTELEGSFLGAAATVDLVSPDLKWKSISSIRYRNNRLLVNKEETKSTYNPTFMDMQTLIHFQPTPEWDLSFFGSISGNHYKYSPQSRRSTFGTINAFETLNIYYSGNEDDKYSTLSGAFKAEYTPDNNNQITTIISAYQTKEQEYYDIEAAYYLTTNPFETDNPIYPTDDKLGKGIANQWNHSRNDYDAIIFNAEIKGLHKVADNTFEWGAKYTREDIKNRLVEWEVIDSLGFATSTGIRPSQFGEVPFGAAYTRSANHAVPINRLAAFVQWSKQFEMDKFNLTVNAGARSQFWTISEAKTKSNIVFSPRVQVALKPYWKKDMLFRFAVGLYQQPPSYKEYIALNGDLNLDLKAQQSLQTSLGYDYSFTINERPFKIQTELYLKYLTNVNTYTLDNVHIRYKANNDAVAYAYGVDMRFYGEFVPGSESWVSIGYLKTEENYNDKGYIARPTDQRFKFGLLFQDYMPQIPNLKLYLNLVYNTGLLGGSPAYADPYDYQMRLKDYKRADTGFTYVFKDQKNGLDKSWLQGVERLELGFEIYNLFDSQNTITNTWVRDLSTNRQYAIPNYMTSRTFNLKINLAF